MSVNEHEAVIGRRRVRVLEQDFTGAESVFYIGRKESRVELRYDADVGVSFYECDVHGRRTCGHVRTVRAALRAGVAR